MDRMKKYFFVVFFCLFGIISSYSQTLRIYYSSAIWVGVVDDPIYHYCFAMDGMIEIKDSAFVNHMQSIIDTIPLNTSDQWKASLDICPVHVILQPKDWGEYYTIDLGLTISEQFNKPKPLWIDGKRRVFSPKLQQIIDDTVKSKLIKSVNVNDPEFLKSVINGSGLKIDYYDLSLPKAFPNGVNEDE